MTLTTTWTPARLRSAGVATLFGGLGWLVAGTVASTADLGDRTLFSANEVVWIVADSLLLLGLLGFARSGAAAGRLGLAGVGGAVLGRLVFVAAEIQALAQGNDETPLLPVAVMLSALGMTVAGIAVLRAGHWGGWRRLVPLATGLYPFVFMIPFAATNPEPPMPAIAVWGVLWALLGLALRNESEPAAP
jgi:hypothetical protein